MGPPRVIADRFEIERLAGAGGMGLVYRAIDRQTGLPVAVKTIARLDADSLERFENEARILAELDHPRIVRHVAHGRTPAGQYLAMEWLEGETLAERLLHGRLAIADSVALIEQVAGALAVVHARGMVHRDIKPSNLFLVGGAIQAVKVLDFGLARHGVHGTALSGTVVGTPGYVAPEQAQGTRGLDARADVFALGAVLFECLTGRPAFVGGNVMAVLAKILLEEPPRVRDLDAAVPPALDALVARALSKDPGSRPRDGAALADELRRAGDGAGTQAAVDSEPAALTTGEQHLLSVILARPAARGWDERAPRPENDDWHETRKAGPDSGQPTLLDENAAAAAPPAGGELDDARTDELRRVAARHRGSLERLADGSLVVVLRGSGAATDQAARAARCALGLRAALPGAAMAVATGRGMVALRFPVGEAIDAAARLLRDSLDAAGGRLPPLRIDETTAGLLDARFLVGGDRRGLDLEGERPEVEPARTLLGKPSPFVGRERELAFLTGLYDECAAEPMARPVLVTAPAGAGKSRLSQELRARLARLPRPPEVWIARGDPSRAGSPFGMLAAALRRAAGILDGETVEVRRQKLRARVARHLDRAEVDRVSEFIGELIGARFDDDDRVQLRAARRDLVLKGEQMRRAFEDWVAAEAGAGPLVLVLEDLNWGDLPTVKFVDAALRHAHERPLLVLALARPDVHQLFPDLWSERGVQELRLGELTRRSGERLIREALGAVASDDVVARIGARAAGNPLYLEELIRATAERRQELPPTVLAMMAARIEELEPEARRILRAASIFGQIFWRDAVDALLGGARGERQLDDWLAVLVDREVIVRRQESERRFPGEEEYSFRHALMRDAAYALLTEPDRALGHSLAAGWLLAAGDENPSELAEHLAAGPADGRVRATAQLLRAAERALEGNDFAGAFAAAERGLGLAAGDDHRGRLRLIIAEAKNWLGEFAAGEDAAAAALARLPRASIAWFKAVGQLAVACVRRGNLARLVPLIDELIALGALAARDPRAAGLDRDALAAFVESSARAAHLLILGGRRDLGVALLEQISPVASAYPQAELGPAASATLLGARATEALYAGMTEACYELSQASAERYLAAGSLRLACVVKTNAAFACIQCGALAEAEAVLRELLPLGRRLGIPNIVASAQHNLGYVLAQRGALDEAIALEREALASLRTQGDRRLEGSATTYLAFALAGQGELAAAEAEAERAVELLAIVPPLQAHALAVLAHVRLSAGRAHAARAPAEQALAILRQLGNLEEGESLVRLVDALTLDAIGRRDDARAALAAASARLHERARRLGDAWRRAFLAVPENQRTLELARSWQV